MFKEGSGKESKENDLLVSVAESIGSTLGSIAAKVSATKRTLTPGTRSVKPTQRRRTASRAAKKAVKRPAGARSAKRKSRTKPRRTARRSKRADQG